MRKRDFDMCWGCWKVPAAVVFCPSCKEKEETADTIKREAVDAHKKLVQENAIKRREKNDYYNY